MKKNIIISKKHKAKIYYSKLRRCMAIRMHLRIIGIWWPTLMVSYFRLKSTNKKPIINPKYIFEDGKRLHICKNKKEVIDLAKEMIKRKTKDKVLWLKRLDEL